MTTENDPFERLFDRLSAWASPPKLLRLIVGAVSLFIVTVVAIALFRTFVWPPFIDVLATIWVWLIEKPHDWDAPTHFEVASKTGLGLLAIAGFWLAIQRTRALSAQAAAAQASAEAALAQSKTAAGQMAVMEQGNITERFAHAIEQLGHEQMAVRLGAIYALWRIGKESATDYPSVVNVLCAFVRAPTHDAQYAEAMTVYDAAYRDHEKREEGGDTPEKFIAPTPPRPREDVQAIITLFGLQRTKEQENQDHPIDFTGADLRRFNMWGHILFRVNFVDADLTNANLGQSDLMDAILMRSDLTGAILKLSDLTGAFLRGANLSGADLESCFGLNQRELDSAYITSPEQPPRNLPEGLKPPPVWRKT